MVLGYHASDHQPLPDEDAIMSALSAHNIPAGNYVMPHASTPAAMKEPDYIAKRDRGPVGFLIVRPAGQTGMGKELGVWFVFCIVVGVFAAYISGRALGPGAGFSEAMRFAGATAFVAYALGTWQEAIWMGRKWSTALKNTFDGLLYGLATGAVFGWLWPGM
jgi:hypothetical protein